MTVTVRAADLDILTEKARDNILRTKSVYVTGRFHTNNHSHAVDKLGKLVRQSKGLEFPDIKEMQVPVRNTADCENIYGGSLTELALENTL